MKKYLIVLAAAVVALASCGNQGGNAYTKISFKESAIDLAIGYSDKLVVLYEPTTLEPPTCEWSSSAPEIVSVENGVITGLKEGTANITAKVGDLSAVCKVTTKDPMEMIEWAGASWWSSVDHTPLTTDTIEVTLTSGKVVHCVPSATNFWIWSEGIYYDDEEGLMGAGYAMYGQGMGLLITEDLGKGENYYILGGTNPIIFTDNMNWTDSAYLWCAATGKITGTAEENWAYWNDQEGTVPAAWSGTEVFAINFETQKYIDGLAGFAAPGIFQGDETFAYYKANINFFTGDCGYGLLWVEDAEGSWSPKQPLEWAPLKGYYYENLPQSSVAKKNFVATDRPMPNFKNFEKVSTQKDVFTIKK